MCGALLAVFRPGCPLFLATERQVGFLKSIIAISVAFFICQFQRSNADFILPSDVLCHDAIVSIASVKVQPLAAQASILCGLLRGCTLQQSGS